MAGVGWPTTGDTLEALCRWDEREANSFQGLVFLAKGESGGKLPAGEFPQAPFLYACELCCRPGVSQSVVEGMHHTRGGFVYALYKSSPPGGPVSVCNVKRWQRCLGGPVASWSVGGPLRSGKQPLPT